MRVLLASTSPARLMLLRQVGIEPETHAPGTDEDAVLAAVQQERGHALTAAETVVLLARVKAADVVKELTEQAPNWDGIVIGGDSVFAFGGEVYGKPHTPQEATRRWQLMRGGTGILHSGLCVYRIRPDSAPVELFAHDQAGVTFSADITDQEIADYVASGEPLQVAGGFTVDSLGGAFIERVEGDPATVVGMSLSRLRKLVTQHGVGWTSLWP